MRCLRVVMMVTIGAVGYPSPSPGQSREQLSEAFAIAVQRTTGEEYDGRVVRLRPIDASSSDSVVVGAYEMLIGHGYEMYEGERWPGANVALVGVSGPRPLRSAVELRVHVLLPSGGSALSGDVDESYTTVFRGYVLVCEGAECTLSDEATLGHGGGVILASCVPDYFRRSPQDRVGCTARAPSRRD